MTCVIDYDSDIFELADRGLASARKAVFDLFAEHAEHGVPVPYDLLMAMARQARLVSPQIKSKKGVHDNGFRAWENAVSVKQTLDNDPSLTVDKALTIVAEDACLSRDTIKSHWQRFAQNEDFKHDRIPSLALLGSIPVSSEGKAQGRKKIDASSYRDLQIP